MTGDVAESEVDENQHGCHAIVFSPRRLINSQMIGEFPFLGKLLIIIIIVCQYYLIIIKLIVFQRHGLEPLI